MLFAASDWLPRRVAEARAKVSSGHLEEAAKDVQEAWGLAWAWARAIGILGSLGQVLPMLQELGDHRAAGAAKLLLSPQILSQSQQSQHACSGIFS